MRIKRTTTLIIPIAIAALVIVVAPYGTHNAYPTTVLPDTQRVEACNELPANNVSPLVGTRARGEFRQLRRPDAEVENLFPSISRTQCAYKWDTPCPTSHLKSLALVVIDEPTNEQALSRYVYEATILQQDSTNANGYRAFGIQGRRAYELVIGAEVLVRVDDGPFILDLQATTCQQSSASSEESSLVALVDALHLPVSDNAVSSGTPNKANASKLPSG